ncbi:hypothetical protein Vqi01_02980 [Micromonospora qiuiae]|uniref:DUF262 domain-containing protein n=2 Tax=Micromonospora qiuiae TaxID=502268 RepID=A0ABQ4J4P0_9ACTN|nr:hypothetical protein Vqi01_02980 [Micromonospora qiuiae]
MGLTMDANTYSLKQILTQDRRYIIPTFQRDYEWTLEGQWKLLFDDLAETADRLFQARQQAAINGEPLAKADKKVPPHFLGAIVCDQLAAAVGGLDLRAVIDGQQRLTTVQLILRGVLDVLIEHASPRARQVRRLLENHPDIVDSPEEQHKLWPRRKDREVWPLAMGDMLPDEGTHLYLQARRYFSERTREAVHNAEPERLDVLVDALLDLFKLVVIDLEDNDDAQVIFEVLNGRQTPLSAADLVKNLLFLRGELCDEKELEKVYDTYWAPFDEQWWKTEVGRGHAQRGRRDVLLSGWLTAVSRSEASVSHLYSQVRGYLDGADRKTVDVLAELHDFGRAYRVVVGAEPAESAALRRSYQRIDALGITTATPLLMWLRTLPSDYISVVSHASVARAVESWVVRRLLVGANTRGYGKVFVDVLKAADQAPADDALLIDAVLRVLHGVDGMLWPDDDELVKAFVTRKFYGNLTQERIRLALGSIDQHLQESNPKTEPATFQYEKLQIEHVMPRQWRQHWPLESADDAGRLFEAQRRDEALNRIGNLTLVTPTFNGAVSNAGWAEKRPAFAEQSKLQINGLIAMQNAWTVETIEARGRALAKVACEVWPRPLP